MLYSLQATPGGLEFSQDMFLNIPLLADWQTVLTQRGQLVNATLLCANKNCINFDYQIDQKVLKYDKMLYGKLKPKTTQPFGILCCEIYCSLENIMCPCLLHIAISGAHTFVILFGIHTSSSLITEGESVMPSCASLMISRSPLLKISVPPSLVVCDIMSTCHVHAPLPLYCFVLVCIELLV